MAKAKVKRKVPTVDLIRNQNVPQSNSAMKPMMGSAINMGASNVPGTLRLADLPSSQALTMQEMESEKALSVGLGPTEVNGVVASGNEVSRAKFKVKKKK